MTSLEGDTLFLCWSRANDVSRWGWDTPSSAFLASSDGVSVFLLRQLSPVSRHVAIPHLQPPRIVSSDGSVFFLSREAIGKDIIELNKAIKRGSNLYWN